MEWTYKKTVIRVESDGRFYFSVNGNAEVTDTLEAAKSRIDSLLAAYYAFTKREIDKLCRKLDKREAEFVRSLIEELERHRFNAYCEIGISDEMLFSFS